MPAEPMIRALPLWQPWASLVVHGKKKIETRHWEAPSSVVGQRIAIHATKTRSELGIVRRKPFKGVLRALLEAGAPLMDPHNPNELPLGALVGTVVVAGCERMTWDFVLDLERADPVEYAFGLYEEARYAWHLADPRVLPQPVPWKGSQGIFSVPASAVDVGIQPAQGSLL